MTHVHPMLGLAFAGLDLSGVAWVLLRGEDGLGDPVGDVDLLVDPAGMGRVTAALVGAGFAPWPVLGRGSHRFFLGFSQQDERWIKLDIVTELSYGPGFTTRAEMARACLAARVAVDGGWASLAPDDAFWTLLLHTVLDKGGASEARWARLRELAAGARPDSPWAAVVDALGVKGWRGATALASVMAGDTQGFASFTHGAQGAVRSSPGAAIGAAWSRIAAVLEPAATALARPGLTVAFLGQDGAGKSTIAALVAAALPLPSRRVYMGLWGQRRPKPLLPGFDLSRRLVFAWRAYLKGQWHRALGRVVMFDRYTYDVLLGASTITRRKQWIYTTVLARSCPPPDLVILLDAPAAVTFARKGEHDVEKLERDRREFLALVERRPGSVIVDASQPVDCVRAAVLQAMWSAYLERFRP